MVPRPKKKRCHDLKKEVPRPKINVFFHLMKPWDCNRKLFQFFLFLSLFIHHISFHFFYLLFLHFIFYIIVFILLITPVAHINTGGKHTIYFFNIMVLDGLQHNFSFLFFYKIFAIGLIDGVILFFTHFKICLDGKIDFFFY